MDTATIRQRLHNYLEVADDKKIKAIYTMVEEEIKGLKVDYTDEFKTELDRRHRIFKKNPATAVSATESKHRIEKILKDAGAK